VIFFAEFIERTYVDDSWVPTSPEPPLGSLQFTILEVENALLELDSSKGLGPDVFPPLIMKNCARLLLPLPWHCDIVCYCKVFRIAGVQDHVLGSERPSCGLSTWLC
jgi:hypothetical protein